MTRLSSLRRDALSDMFLMALWEGQSLNDRYQSNNFCVMCVSVRMHVK